MAGMDDWNLRYLADNRLIYHQRKHHESIDRGSGHRRPWVLGGYKDLDVTHAGNGQDTLKGDDINELC